MVFNTIFLTETYALYYSFICDELELLADIFERKQFALIAPDKAI